MDDLEFVSQQTGALIGIDRSIAWFVLLLYYELTFYSILEPLNCLLAFDDIATQTDASWAISYITDSGEDHVSAVCAFDRPHSMVQQLMRNGAHAAEDKLLTPTIRALGNIVTGTDQQTQACLDNVSRLRYFVSPTHTWSFRASSKSSSV